MNRYKQTDWESTYRQSRMRLKVFVTGPGRNNVIASEAQLMLRAHYRGPWKMIVGILKHEIFSLWLHYGWMKWEWIRVNVFRLPQDEAIAAAEEAEFEEMLERIVSKI